MISTAQITGNSVSLQSVSTTSPRRVLSVSFFFMIVQLFLSLPQSSTAFQSQGLIRNQHVSPLLASVNAEDEITRQLERAKALLAKSKAKMEAKQTGSFLERDDESKIPVKPSTNTKIPFFASQVVSKTKGSKREKVIKAKNEEGLVTIDGDLMAKLSESEEWEIRSLRDVFENETKNLHDPFADRDVAASIFGLQKVLQTEDFQKIFDKRNRFIGEQ